MMRCAIMSYYCFKSLEAFARAGHDVRLLVIRTSKRTSSNRPACVTPGRHGAQDRTFGFALHLGHSAAPHGFSEADATAAQLVGLGCPICSPLMRATRMAARHPREDLRRGLRPQAIANPVASCARLKLPLGLLLMRHLSEEACPDFAARERACPIAGPPRA